MSSFETRPTTYEVKPNQPDSHQVSCWWTMCVVRFDRMRTVDRAKISTFFEGNRTELDVSDKEAAKDPVGERPPLVLGSQVLSWNINESKSSYVSSANFRIAPVMDLARAISSGDWVFFWVHDNETDRNRVLATIRRIVGTHGAISRGNQTFMSERPREDGTQESQPTESCNGFRDGLRFVGRANAPKESEEVDPATGRLRTIYDLTATGFGELNSKVYFTPASQAAAKDAGDSGEGIVAQYTKLASAVDLELSRPLPLTLVEHFQIWMSIFLGSGPGVESKGYRDPTTNDPQLAALTLSPNDAFLVPYTAAALLGVRNWREWPQYRDVLNSFIGIQCPSEESGINDIQKMVPVALKDSDGKHTPPSGTFRPQYADFSDVSIWDLLSRYSNTPVNEMFTCLKLSGDGTVMPTLTVRQTPYTSKRTARELVGKDVPVVAFADLPRWHISNKMVTGIKVGPSDSLRVNFVAIQGVDVPNDGNQGVSKQTINTTNAPPMADMVDIRRHGLRPFIRTLNSDITGLIEKTGLKGLAYTTLLADAAFTGHLKWTGSLSCFGITEPVAVGDNLEYNHVVYQIEGRQDSGGIDEMGRKSWRTTFSLSNGISVETDHAEDDIMPHEDGAHEHERPWVNQEQRAGEFEGAIDFTLQEWEDPGKPESRDISTAPTTGRGSQIES